MIKNTEIKNPTQAPPGSVGGKETGMKTKIGIAWLLAWLLLLTGCGGRSPAPTEQGAAPSTASPAFVTQETGSETTETPPASAAVETPGPETLPETEPTEAPTEEPPEETREPEPWAWSYAAPESQGMDSEALARVHKTYESFPLLAAVIVRNGLVVDAYYKEGYDESSVFTLQSTSKSITSALVGIALEQGCLESLDQPLSDFFPELHAASDPRWAKITLRHLLNHTSGIASTDSPRWYEWRASENWLDYLFALPIYTEPGTSFDYSTGNTHLLSAVLERATGIPLADYAQEVLFEPLGITDARLETAPEGVGDGGNGFSMKTLDLARFGLLYLNGGVWQARQIVPADWVTASTTTQAKRTSDGSRYGYQWWVRSLAAMRPLWPRAITGSISSSCRTCPCCLQSTATTRAPAGSIGRSQMT